MLFLPVMSESREQKLNRLRIKIQLRTTLKFVSTVVVLTTPGPWYQAEF